MYVIQMNDGRVFETPAGEAKFWAWLSMDYCICNVYAVNGNGYTLSPFEIRS